MMVKAKDNFEKQLFSITTLVRTEVVKHGVRHIGQASGFFYNETTPTDPNRQGAQWHKLEKYWLITNRHVVLPKIDDVECMPDFLVFSIRQNINDAIEWKPIVLTKDQLRSALKLHKDKIVDVAAIDITPYIQVLIDEIAANKGVNNYFLPLGLSNSNLPANQPLTIDVTSDIIVASYPKGFYDKVNKFPIVKSGIVASAWNFNFNGLPIFQIDAQLFPGSSGGLVISKPVNVAMINGELKHCKTKQFVFLGVYSGEFKWDEDIVIAGDKHTFKNSYGLGNVWYSYLVPEIIRDGVAYTKQ